MRYFSRLVHVLGALLITGGLLATITPAALAPTQRVARAPSVRRDGVRLGAVRRSLRLWPHGRLRLAPWAPCGAAGDASRPDFRPGTAEPVACPSSKHCALRALLPHSRVRGWSSSGCAAWGPAQSQVAPDRECICAKVH